MNIFDIKKLLEPLRNKIMLMIGRCILTAVTNSGKTQKVSVTGLNGETISDVERMEEYGFTTYPKKDCEITVVFLGGNRDRGLAICAHDRTYRPKTLSEGDVCLYDYRGTQILISSAGITLKTDDASLWCPNIMTVCPFSGAIHGGVGAGIVKLKGE